MQEIEFLSKNQTIQRTINRAHGLDERQAKFVEAILSGATVSEAERVARYAKNSGNTVILRPSVQAAIAAGIDASLKFDLAPLAIAAARAMISSDKTTDGARTTLILGVLDRAGYSADRFKRQAADSGRDVTQMKAEELRAEIDRLQREIEGRAIDITPNDAPDIAQALEIYE